MSRLSACLALALLLPAAPVLAQTAGAKVDEPANAALFALGLAGLLIGRRVARRRD